MQHGVLEWVLEQKKDISGGKQETQLEPTILLLYQCSLGPVCTCMKTPFQLLKQ